MAAMGYQSFLLLLPQLQTRSITLLSMQEICTRFPARI
jgi:hypothetical protein